VIDNALAFVDDLRAELGAVQNRFSFDHQQPANHGGKYQRRAVADSGRGLSPRKRAI
jgi:hypothetical protein